MITLSFKINPQDLDNPRIADKIVSLSRDLPLMEPSWIEHFSRVADRLTVVKRPVEPTPPSARSDPLSACSTDPPSLCSIHPPSACSTDPPSARSDPPLARSDPLSARSDPPSAVSQVVAYLKYIRDGEFRDIVLSMIKEAGNQHLPEYNWEAFATAEALDIVITALETANFGPLFQHISDTLTQPKSKPVADEGLQKEVADFLNHHRRNIPPKWREQAGAAMKFVRIDPEKIRERDHQRREKERRLEEEAKKAEETRRVFDKFAPTMREHAAAAQSEPPISRQELSDIEAKIREEERQRQLEEAKETRSVFNAFISTLQQRMMKPPADAPTPRKSPFFNY